MKQLCLRVLILVTALGLAGCTALLPSSSAVSPSSFDSFEAAQAALEKTVPYKTTLEELKALGFDPQASANVSNHFRLFTIRSSFVIAASHRGKRKGARLPKRPSTLSDCRLF